MLLQGAEILETCPSSTGLRSQGGKFRNVNDGDIRGACDEKTGEVVVQSFPGGMCMGQPRDTAVGIQTKPSHTESEFESFYRVRKKIKMVCEQ